MSRTAGIAAGAASLVLSSYFASRLAAFFRAYVVAFPLVLLDTTRRNFVRVNGRQDVLLCARRFPDASFRAVVRPNLDTLYALAFLDMDAGPLVLVVPPGRERYEVLQLMDAWSNVFEAPGTRLRGTTGGNFLIAGPKWAGVVPDGLHLLRSPTRTVWLIGRTQTNSEDDYATVHRLHDELVLSHLDEWTSGRPSDRSGPVELGGKTSESPADEVAAMSAGSFFSLAAGLLQDNPLCPADPSAAALLRSVGVEARLPFAPNAIDALAARLGKSLADRFLALAPRFVPAEPSGWSTPPAEIGRFGTNYLLRAVVALAGLGANVPEDAVYPTARVDGQGRVLDGSRKYRLRFPPGGTPPVKAFWSLTAYDSDGFLIPNPAGRHAVGSLRPLAFGDDGSLELAIQAAEPGTEQNRTNWLPVREGQPFALTARLYWPEESVLRKEWTMPPIERVM
ncbi:hypothetical protein DFJ74DRAFT_276921 [Hyaloraphidium curvatum]|nr:hypothetical protein DFJ74DRAFT_276921 [Hyaloraphidium curvatum]